MYVLQCVMCTGTFCLGQTFSPHIIQSYTSLYDHNNHAPDVQHKSYTSLLSLLLLAALLLLCRYTSQRTLRPLVSRNNILHTSHIMLGLAHVCQSRSSRSLLPSLHNLDSLYIRTVDLIPHLHSDSGQLIAEQNATIDTSATDVDAYSCERVTGLETHEKDITNFGSFWVGFGEEVGAGTCGIEDGDLVCGEVFYRFAADFCY